MESDFLYRIRIAIIFILIWVIGHILYIVLQCNGPNCESVEGSGVKRVERSLTQYNGITNKTLQSFSKNINKFNQHFIGIQRSRANLTACIKNHFRFSDKIFRPPRYDVNALEHLCSNKTIAAIMVVPSRANDIKKRSLIRKTWKTHAKMFEFGIQIIFVVGISRGNSSTLLTEVEQHGDIVHTLINNYAESKVFEVLTAFHWVTNYCPKVRWFMKTDIAENINPTKLQGFLEAMIGQQNNTILCRDKFVRDVYPCRSYNCNRQQIISKEEYPFEYYPHHCSGSTYLISTPLMIKLYDEARKRKIFPVENIYITGILPLFLSQHPLYKYLPENYLSMPFKRRHPNPKDRYSYRT